MDEGKAITWGLILWITIFSMKELLKNYFNQQILFQISLEMLIHQVQLLKLLLQQWD